MLKHDPDRHREIVVITDGILADEKPVLELLEEELGEGRLFVVGTGPDLYQDTLLRLAEYGRGAVTFASEPAGLELAIAEPQPNVLNLASSMTPVSAFTLTCSFITSPHSGAPTRPVPTLASPFGREPTLRGLSK